MKQIKRVVLLSVLAISCTLLWTNVAAARKSAQDCGCSSGIPKNKYGKHSVPPIECGKSTYSKQVQQMHDDNPSSMFSCCRPKWAQERLRSCYIKCGFPRHAARSSQHTLGQACDVSNKSLYKKYGLNLLFHDRSAHVHSGGGAGGGGSPKRYNPQSKRLSGGKNRSKSRPSYRRTGAKTGSDGGVGDLIRRQLSN